MSDKNENMDDLLSDFYDQQQSGEFKNELNSLQELLDANPAPRPSSQTIDKIKSDVTDRIVLSQKSRRYNFVRKFAVAAVILMVAIAGVKMINQHPARQIAESEKTFTGSIFDEQQFSQTEIAALTREVEQIEDSMLTIRLDEFDTYQSDSFLEIDTELTEINGDFWKG
jgi:negative regulator of sigma E activity